MKQIKLFSFVLLITLVSCSKIRKMNSTYAHFDPVAYTDTNEVAKNYIKSYLVASFVHDQLNEIYKNSIDDTEQKIILGEIILNKQLYMEDLTYTYCKDSLKKVLDRAISSYSDENKDTTSSVNSYQTAMNLIEISLALCLNNQQIIRQSDQLLDYSKSLIEPLSFNAQEIKRSDTTIVYQFNILNSNFDKYPINVKFNFDVSGEVRSFEIL